MIFVTGGAGFIGSSFVLDFDTGIRKTVRRYLDHPDSVAAAQDGSYRERVSTNYAERTLP